MAQRVMLKREEKAKVIFEDIRKNCSFEDFLKVFKVKYPKDYSRICKKFNKEERKDVNRKGHSMSFPEKYVRNFYNYYIGKKCILFK